MTLTNKIIHKINYFQRFRIISPQIQLKNHFNQVIITVKIEIFSSLHKKSRMHQDFYKKVKKINKLNWNKVNIVNICLKNKKI